MAIWAFTPGPICLLGDNSSSLSLSVGEDIILQGIIWNSLGDASMQASSGGSGLKWRTIRLVSESADLVRGRTLAVLMGDVCALWLSPFVGLPDGLELSHPPCGGTKPDTICAIKHNKQKHIRTDTRYLNLYGPIIKLCQKLLIDKFEHDKIKAEHQNFNSDLD